LVLITARAIFFDIACRILSCRRPWSIGRTTFDAAFLAGKATKQRIETHLGIVPTIFFAREFGQDVHLPQPAPPIE
jgi:hypothetical protein